MFPEGWNGFSDFDGMNFPMVEGFFPHVLLEKEEVPHPENQEEPWKRQMVPYRSSGLSAQTWCVQKDGETGRKYPMCNICAEWKEKRYVD